MILNINLDLKKKNLLISASEIKLSQSEIKVQTVFESTMFEATMI